MLSFIVYFNLSLNIDPLAATVSPRGLEEKSRVQIISLLRERILSTMEIEVPSAIVTDSNESAQLNTFFDFSSYFTSTDQHLQTNDNVELLVLQYFTDNRNDYTSLNA